MALLPFLRKSYSGFLRSEKIHRPQLGSNPQTSDPKASMITPRAPGSTVSGFAETVGEGFILHDDNARPHCARSVQWYLVEHGIWRMDWPACSPDMNCIEHAWSFLRRAISNRPHHPLTIQELRNATLEEWDNLPQESLNALVLSMPRRVQECLRVCGGPTHY